MKKLLIIKSQEIKEIEKDYRLNKCQEHGHLPLLKPKCESMLNKINYNFIDNILLFFYTLNYSSKFIIHSSFFCYFLAFYY